MLLNRAGKLLAVPLLILIATAAYGTPTPSVHNSDVFVHASCSSEYAEVPSASTLEMNPISEAYDSHLANIANELLKPPPDFTNSAALLPAEANSLPPVPGALFMVLVGFVCVSLVKDRRLWIAALAGLLWAGQAGFAALPQVASNLVHRKQTEQWFSANVTYTPELDSSDRSRCDVEGTRYIGLLHHLAGIPERKERLHVRVPARQGPKCRAKYLAPPLRRGFPLLKISQFAITHFSPLLNCPAIYLASRVKQPVCFSPAFVFENLPRGPPEIGVMCRFSSI